MASPVSLKAYILSMVRLSVKYFSIVSSVGLSGVSIVDGRGFVCYVNITIKCGLLFEEKGIFCLLFLKVSRLLLSLTDIQKNKRES